MAVRFSDKGFLSTTENKNVAERFSSNLLKEDRTRVLFTIEGSGKDVSAASKFPREKEILYAPSSKFEITSMVKVDNVLRVRMKQNE